MTEIQSRYKKWHSLWAHTPLLDVGTIKGKTSFAMGRASAATSSRRFLVHTASPVDYGFFSGSGSAYLSHRFLNGASAIHGFRWPLQWISLLPCTKCCENGAFRWTPVGRKKQQKIHIILRHFIMSLHIPFYPCQQNCPCQRITHLRSLHPTAYAKKKQELYSAVGCVPRAGTYPRARPPWAQNKIK